MWENNLICEHLKLLKYFLQEISQNLIWGKEGKLDTLSSY